MPVYQQVRKWGRVKVVSMKYPLCLQDTGIYKDNNEAFATLEKLDVIEPNQAKRQEYADAYARWKYRLEKSMAK